MNKRNMTSIGMVALVGLMITGGAALGQQQSLGELVEQEGYGWMLGRWEASMDDGTELLVGFRWGMEKRVVMLDYKIGETTGLGMIYYDPGEDKVLQVTVDSQGRVYRAEWTPGDGKLIVISDFVDEYGQKQSIGYAYSKGEAGGLKIEVFGVENGQPSELVVWSMEYKKVKKAPKKKAEGEKKKTAGEDKKASREKRKVAREKKKAEKEKSEKKK